jgi:triphosphoribosyl-dephospho-CoA synthetase
VIPVAFSFLRIMESWFPLVIHHMLLAFGVMVEGVQDGKKNILELTFLDIELVLDMHNMQSRRY